MKNILSSLTESEKRRILEMHRRASNRHYLSESKIYTEGNYSYKVENNKYYYSTDGGKTWTEQTKPAGIEAIKAVIAKQGGNVAQNPETPPQSPSQFDTPGVHRSVNLPGYGMVSINNSKYTSRDKTPWATPIYVFDAYNDKTMLFEFDCLTGGVKKDSKFKGQITREMSEYMSDNWCGPEVRAKGLMRVVLRNLTSRDGQKFEVTLKKAKNEDIVNITSGGVASFAWYASSNGKFSCSGGNFTEGEDKFTKAMKPVDIANFIKDLKNFCQTGM